MSAPVMRPLRVWIHHPVTGDPVRLTLTPDVPLHYWHRSETDEGWTVDAVEWVLSFDSGRWVLRERWMQDGRDCDGRVTGYGEREAVVPVVQWLRHHAQPGWPVDYRPEWRNGEEEWRDHAAEAAGY